MKLTKTKIDSSVYEGTDGEHDIRWDADVPGFGLRIYPSGKKSFLISYRYKGRKRRMVLGAYGLLTLDKARKEAKVKLASVIQGQDPLEVRIREQSGKLMSDLIHCYIEQHAKIRKKTWREDERRLNKHLKKWMNRRIDNIADYEVVALHGKIGSSTIYEANRTYEIIRKMFEFAKANGFLDKALPNPAIGVEKFAEKERDRWVTHEELPRLIIALQKEKNRYAAAAVLLYLLTGLRKTELLKSKWEDINVFRNEIKVSETKAGNDHYVPLSDRALEVLKSIPRTIGNPHIFPGRGKTGHIVNMTKPWNRIRKEAGVEDVRLHDLRRTAGSWMAQRGDSLHLIGKILNHASIETTRVYARLSQNQERAALDVHAKELGKFIDGKVNCETPLQKRN